MGQRRDIDTIHCYIDFSQDTNNFLFSRWEIHSKISKFIARYLKQYGLQYEIIPLGGMGGGRAETLWNIIKLAWNNKDIIGIFIVSIKAVLDIPKYIKSILNSYAFQSKPSINISFTLQTEQNFTDKDLNIALGKRLINLKFISDDICKKLSINYSIFRFNQRFNLFVYPRKFGVSYEFNAEHQNTFNTYRLIRLFKDLRIKDNLSSRYSFTKWFVISRLDEKLNIEGKTRIKTPYKKYYLFLSTHIISDYF